MGEGDELANASNAELSKVGLRVRLRDNPGKQGVATGKSKQIGTRQLVQIEFGPNEKLYKDAALIEPVAIGHDPLVLLGSGRIGKPSDLRRILIYEKIKGNLTNIFYSMESSNTDFYPHQFRPVLNFIESPAGRLLIADEVGLGKTIEAIYIWKEVQARYEARRLLVVCPAKLREKWRRDLSAKFDIVAEITRPKELLQRLRDVAAGNHRETFINIVSLESIGVPKYYDAADPKGDRAELARLLDQNPMTPDFALFDQVIIDEAHYLRNPTTGFNRVGRLLRDASRHLVLLTATPIQLSSDNLYQLMRLVDEDVFYDSKSFDLLMRGNTHIVRAQRALWSQPPNREAAMAEIDEALQSVFFLDDAVLTRTRKLLAENTLDQALRIETLRLLESRSLLSQYMSRSRKREVMKDRVERSPQLLEVRFSEPELAVYKSVTNAIRRRSEGLSGVNVFALMVRQRQMASSIVGALESWESKSLLDELFDDDLGMLAPTIIEEDCDDGEIEAALQRPDVDIRELERVDVKYQRLRNFIRDEMQKNPAEKFVVFAFFKGTLNYLNRRLREDGVSTALLHGDINEEKSGVTDRFESADGPSVLLSSEVGSEGIDLQFCRFLVNYDLPWNPMRIEQRIGRLDRLGQRSPRISIINLQVTNTIEDRIVMRLYERINVFRESIGDLEDILGQMTEKLVLELLNPQLSDEERMKNAEDSLIAIENSRRTQERLESEAVNLVGFSDYIMNNIRDSRDHGRWLSGGEIVLFVEDFFEKKYPGVRIIGEGIDNKREITLSDAARQDLYSFIQRARPSTRTRLHKSQQPIACVFDPRKSTRLAPGSEFIDTTHPLILWIKESYGIDTRSIFPVSAVSLDSDTAGAAPGEYAYVIQRWSLKGLRHESELVFSAVKLGGDTFLAPQEAEELVVKASRHGVDVPNASNIIGDISLIHGVAHACEEQLFERFGDKLEEFEAENKVRCDAQETSARNYARRRMGELEGRIARFRMIGSSKLLPMTEGLLKKEREQLDEKLNRISALREVDPTPETLATGYIKVV